MDGLQNLGYVATMWKMMVTSEKWPSENDTKQCSGRLRGPTSTRSVIDGEKEEEAGEEAEEMERPAGGEGRGRDGAGKGGRRTRKGGLPAHHE